MEAAPLEKAEWAKLARRAHRSSEQAALRLGTTAYLFLGRKRTENLVSCTALQHRSSSRFASRYPTAERRQGRNPTDRDEPTDSARSAYRCAHPGPARNWQKGSSRRDPRRNSRTSPSQ